MEYCRAACAATKWSKTCLLCCRCYVKFNNPCLRSQIIIVSCTAFAGVLALNYQRDYTVWVLPLIIVCLFAFLVAHCFLSVFENVVDVLFLCFAVDSKFNNGSEGREYYMDKALMVRPSRLSVG